MAPPGGLQDSWPRELIARLRRADVLNAITLFGAALLLSVLPLAILLSSIADQRIDDDLSRHLGLNGHGAHIIEGLFRTKPSHDAGAIALGVIIGLAGTIAMVSFLQEIYERAFGLEARGWRNFPRFLLWVAVLIALLVGEGALAGQLRHGAGPTIKVVLNFVLAAAFLAWTMHLLLAGRARWKALVRPALLSAVLWLLLGVFSSLYFSSAIVSDRRLYGTIGVIFTLLTWFIAIGAVIVLGAVGGAIWQERSDGERRAPTPEGSPGD